MNTQDTLNNLLNNSTPIEKMVLSKSKKAEYKKQVLVRSGDFFQISKYTEAQVFHIKITIDHLLEYLLEEIQTQNYRQINAWSEEKEFSIFISKKGEVSTLEKSHTNKINLQPTHNRKKHYIIQEGTIVPPLIDMGVMTKDGKIIHSMYSKFKQINKFLELIENEIEHLGDRDVYRIIDFGSGKSYLTFLIYYYLVELRGKNVDITGIDLKSQVVENCNILAKKYNYSNLVFFAGDIKDFQSGKKIDLVISLHACDTATDYAIFHATDTLEADTILSVPCCQHEINKQIKTNTDMSIFLEHGIVKERFSSLLTDTLRAKLLHSKGYKTNIIEFIDMEHTPKNIMIRARKSKLSQESRQKAKEEVESLCAKFSITQTLKDLYYK